MNPLARAYQLYQQYVGEPFQQTVRGGVRGYFGLPMMTDASSVGREAYRQGEALGFTPGVGMPAGAVRVAAEGMQALPSIAGDIGRVIGGLPSGAAARQAEDFAAYQRSIPPSDVSPLTAFHGTPHTFAAEEGAPLGRFRAGKIGSGEGAQAYGYGLYFAENPGVAKGYQSALSADRGFSFAGKTNLTRAEVQDMVNQKYGSGYLDSVIRPSGVADSFIDDMITGVQRKEGSYPRNYKPGSERAKLYDELRGQISHANPGSIYTVDIPDAMVDKMLDWDKPLSQQPEVLKAIDRRYDPDVWLEQIGVSKDATGGDLLKALGATRDSQRSAAVSSLLRDFGISGIRYLDRSSRSGGEGTRNIVVFPGEEQNVKILSRE
jgi:hypothetical protein